MSTRFQEESLVLDPENNKGPMHESEKKWKSEKGSNAWEWKSEKTSRINLLISYIVDQKDKLVPKEREKNVLGKQEWN